VFMLCLGHRRPTRWESRDAPVLQAKRATSSLPCTMSAMYVQLLRGRLWVLPLWWRWNPTSLKLQRSAVSYCNSDTHQAPRILVQLG
jgi:hypothetical protein